MPRKIKPIKGDQLAIDPSAPVASPFLMGDFVEIVKGEYRGIRSEVVAIRPDAIALAAVGILPADTWIEFDLLMKVSDAAPPPFKQGDRVRLDPSGDEFPDAVWTIEKIGAARAIVAVEADGQTHRRSSAVSALRAASDASPAVRIGDRVQLIRAFRGFDANAVWTVDQISGDLASVSLDEDGEIQTESTPIANLRPAPDSPDPRTIPGACVRIPRGDRAYVERVHPTNPGRVIITYEAKDMGEDSFPLSMLTLVEYAPDSAPPPVHVPRPVAGSRRRQGGTAPPELPAVAVEAIVVPSLDEQIREAYAELVAGEAEAIAAARRAAAKYCRLGSLLSEKKAEVKAAGGKWLAYLEEVGIQERKAQRAIQIFQKYGDDPAAVEGRTIAEALGLAPAAEPVEESLESSDLATDPPASRSCLSCVHRKTRGNEYACSLGEFEGWISASTDFAAGLADCGYIAGVIEHSADLAERLESMAERRDERRQVAATAGHTTGADMDRDRGGRSPPPSPIPPLEASAYRAPDLPYVEKQVACSTCFRRQLSNDGKTYTCTAGEFDVYIEPPWIPVRDDYAATNESCKSWEGNILWEKFDDGAPPPPDDDDGLGDAAAMIVEAYGATAIALAVFELASASEREEIFEALRGFLDNEEE